MTLHFFVLHPSVMICGLSPEFMAAKRESPLKHWGSSPNGTLKSEKVVFLRRVCQNGGSTKNRNHGEENRHE
jgi:hypothetical protein